MKMGISTACFYPEHTENALARLADMGIEACEIFINSLVELRRDYIGMMRGIAERSGMEVLAVHPNTAIAEGFLFFSGYDRRFEDGLELYRRYYEAAAALGAGIVVFHGNYLRYAVEPDFYFERFLRLREEGRRFGVELCQENVVLYQSRSPEFFSQMSAAIPDARYVFDVKQAVRAGEDVFAFARSQIDRLAHIHLSDHGVAGDCLLPGRGEFNISGFFEILRQNGCDANVIIELYRENFGEALELKESYQHIYTL